MELLYMLESLRTPLLDKLMLAITIRAKQIITIFFILNGITFYCAELVIFLNTKRRLTFR